ncbi:MAG TPA: CBS domain-containing protein [Aeromicrobium sp.]|nr:CBS domain-containing protein [Aeromicrobium sp.]
MTTARDVMTTGTQCIKEDQTLAEAARMMRDLDVGSLPICGADNKLHGMITDRDIVVKCIADDGDCTQTRAGDLAQGSIHWVSADADIDDVLAQMSEHQVKRMPVVEDHRLIGMISETDLTKSNLDNARLADVVSDVYA